MMKRFIRREIIISPGKVGCFRQGSTCTRSTSSGGGDVKIVHEGLREEVGNFESVGLPKNVTAEEARRKAREKRRRMSESLEESRSRTSESGGSGST